MIDPVELIGKPLSSVVALTAESFELSEIEGREYADAPAAGLALVFRDGLVSAVHLYGPRKDMSFEEFKGETPLGLRFNMSRESVRSALGNPEKSRELRTIPIVGMAPASDSYRVAQLPFNIEYSADERSIDLITVMDRRP